ncbi:glycosyltransferase family 4 protein [candidate division WOR-3 bacterium]|nr:glycosyltransferase family 4 protein [candidate division WOR-3 bacterium]
MERVRSVAVIGNYLPRMCGIATFTTDLVSALSSKGIDCWAIAMNDRPEGYRYPKEVRFEINQNKSSEYVLASDYLNISQIDAVSLQHEYGIFGGEYGSYIVSLIKRLRMPVVTTLHTVLKEPVSTQKKILSDIARFSEKIIVMSENASDFLKEIYGVPKDKIVLIHHGIPDMPFVDPNYYKDQFGVEGRKVILTFGLLSPNKGIEYMIDAMPKIMEKHADVVYVIVGATHPNIKKTHGEEYRQSLVRRAKAAGVDQNIMFFNRFVERNELCEFLGACDVYVTPYLSEAQIVSGTLAYAMGVGKATVSTPYWYAVEMMSEDRGVLVGFRDSEALAEAVSGLLSDDIKRNAMRKRAYTFLRRAVWSQVAVDYLAILNGVKNERIENAKVIFSTKTLAQDKTSLPEIDFRHVMLMTDDTGILQHATYSIPDYDHGYCADDNSRGLIASVMAQSFTPEDPKMLNMQKKFLAFLKHSFNDKTGWFRNFMSFERKWLEEKGSEDSQGRAIWGLGVCAALSGDKSCVALSTTLFHRAVEVMLKLSHPRAVSFALVGIHAYLARFSGDSEIRRAREKLANYLFEKFKKRPDMNWPWFDDELFYANAKIPQALLLSGQWMQRTDMSNMGFDLLNWVIELQSEKNYFSPIGNRGWLRKGGSKANFDQQPIEAQAMIETCLLAYNMTGDDKYSNMAHLAFNWFLGQNILNEPLYDFATGGCRDGLTPDGPNMNQGAESTLAWLLSLLAMHGFSAEQNKMQYTVPIAE